MRRSAFLRAVLVLFVWALVILAWEVNSARASSSSPRQTIRQVFGARAPLALRVARCESRLRARAVSSTHDVGIFQVNYSAHHRSGESFAAFKRRMFDVGTNVRFAYRLSRHGTDFSPWRWSAHCWA